MGLFANLEVETAYDDLVWKTEPTSWDDLIQVRAEYVIHARGFTVGPDVWLDEYSLYGDHANLWRQALERTYDDDFPTWDGDSYETLPRDDVLYWSVTGAPSLLVQYPYVEAATGDDIARAAMLCVTLNVPPDARVSWAVSENRRHTITAETLYANV